MSLTWTNSSRIARRNLQQRYWSVNGNSDTTPTSRPAATVDTRQRLLHTISFVDENTPGSRAQPDGVIGCEVWVKVGTAPTEQVS